MSVKPFGDRLRVRLLIRLARLIIPRGHLQVIHSAVGQWGKRPELREQDRGPMREVYYVTAQALLR